MNADPVVISVSVLFLVLFVLYIIRCIWTFLPDDYTLCCCARCHLLSRRGPSAAVVNTHNPFREAASGRLPLYTPGRDMNSNPPPYFNQDPSSFLIPITGASTESYTTSEHSKNSNAEPANVPGNPRPTRSDP